MRVSTHSIEKVNVMQYSFCISVAPYCSMSFDPPKSSSVAHCWRHLLRPHYFDPLIEAGLSFSAKFHTIPRFFA